MSATWQRFTKPTMRITDQMPRKIFRINHVTKLAAAYQATLLKCRKVFYINHVAKFAAAYQANHCSNAALNTLYQPRGKVCRGLPGKDPLNYHFV